MNKIAFTAVIAKLVAGVAFVALAFASPAPHVVGPFFEPDALLDASQARVIQPPLHDQRTLQCALVDGQPVCAEAGTGDSEDDAPASTPDCWTEHHHDQDGDWDERICAP